MDETISFLQYPPVYGDSVPATTESKIIKSDGYTVSNRLKAPRTGTRSL